jgi:hypothetical protein
MSQAVATAGGHGTVGPTTRSFFLGAVLVAAVLVAAPIVAAVVAAALAVALMGRRDDIVYIYIYIYVLWLVWRTTCLFLSLSFN